MKQEDGEGNERTVRPEERAEKKKMEEEDLFFREDRNGTDEQVL